METNDVTLYSVLTECVVNVKIFPPQRPGFKPGSSQVGFVVDKVVLVQVFSDYFGFPCQSSFHHHLPSGAVTIGQ
jgi:hypothetical protein